MQELVLAEVPVAEPGEADAALVREAQRNPAALAALYRRYVTPIHRYLYSRVGNTADAEDLTAEVFTEALRSIARYRERGTFAAWLFTIARRKAADLRRRSRPHVPLDESLHSPDLSVGDPLEYTVDQERLRTLVALVARLSEDEQELLSLRFAAGLGYSQIGELTGRSKGAAKMAIHRLLGRLGREWEADNDAG